MATHVVVGHVCLVRELHLRLAVAHAANVATRVAERPAEHAAHARVRVKDKHLLGLQRERGVGVRILRRRRGSRGGVHRGIHRCRFVLGHREIRQEIRARLSPGRATRLCCAHLKLNLDATRANVQNRLLLTARCERQ